VVFSDCFLASQAAYDFPAAVSLPVKWIVRMSA
jgi:hypothetical protein